MDPTRLTAIRVGRDLARTYTEAEERKLAANLYSLIRGVYQGRFTDRPFSINLLCEINAELFDGVRDHAGRIRSRDFGSETLTFGPNRSTHRDSVPHELDEVFRSATPLLSKLEKNRSAEDYDSKTIQLAVWIHARIIQIHPFEDGNGRTSRVFMNALLVRLGLRPILIEAPKEEYREVLNHYYRSRGIQPLIDLAIRLYVEHL